MGRIAMIVFALLIIAPFTAWAAAALWFDGPGPSLVNGALAAGLVIAIGGVFLRVRRALPALALAGILLAGVVGWWLSLEPSNDRTWLADVAHTPFADFDGSRVTIHNVRNFDYRSETDYDVHWEERTVDLDRLVGVDLFLIYWGSPWIAHTILSWGFEDGQQLAISIETRKEEGEAYSAVTGFFRQFELYYVVADERDVVRLRTNYRGEEVYLYRLQTSLELARAVLVDYLEEINRIAKEPRWYNAATLNCTTAIRHHVENVTAARPLDWRVMLNGRLDEMGYERGTLDRSLAFPELKERSLINETANAADQARDFSTRIRVGLPGFGKAEDS